MSDSDVSSVRSTPEFLTFIRPSPDKRKVLGSLTFTTASGEEKTKVVKDNFAIVRKEVTTKNGDVLVILALQGSSTSHYRNFLLSPRRASDSDSGSDVEDNDSGSLRLQFFLQRKRHRSYPSYQYIISDGEDEDEIIGFIQDKLNAILNGDIAPVAYTVKRKQPRTVRGAKGAKQSRTATKGASDEVKDLLDRLELLEARVKYLESRSQ